MVELEKKDAIVSQCRCWPNDERLIQLKPNYIWFANYWFVDTQSHENIFQKATRNLAESAVDQVNLVVF
jgi:hypothetical protein